MCAIAGVFGGSPGDLAAIGDMIATLAHRGPDDQGIWIDHSARISLGHARLSILDLTSAGHQPMQSANGRFVLSFNGEIYNFTELRREMEQQGLAPDRGWRSQGDAEVLLEAISRWGVQRALARSSGMFAFALWDRRDGRLTLARDRFGEKPLYYGWLGKAFAFASELKALRDHPRFDNAIDPEAVALYLSRRYIPAPFSIFKRVYKLPPGCTLELTRDAVGKPPDAAPAVGDSPPGLRLRRYWSYREVVERGLSAPITDEAEALDRLEQALSAAVARQSVADVPLGAFLSGGIDSSLIVALQQRSSAPVRTYSIGFEDQVYDEAGHARATAAYLGTVHHEEYVTARQARDLLPALPAIFDEPFADASQIPTHILSRLAARDVKVVLTGDGGDELFAGYYQHFLTPHVWRVLQAVPAAVRHRTMAALSRVPPKIWDHAARLLAKHKQGQVGFKIRRALAAAATSNSIDDFYRGLIEEWDAGSFPMLGAAPRELPMDPCIGPNVPDGDRLMHRDAISFLPDDILCKVDRASMAASLETRAPFLDPQVAEIAARIPFSMKVQQGRGKCILRKLLGRSLPAEWANRPKRGFSAPIGSWLRGPLRPWAEDLLNASTMRDDGWLRPDVVSSCWRDHLSGRRDSTDALWGVLTFNSWLRHSAEFTRSAEPAPALNRQDC